MSKPTLTQAIVEKWDATTTLPALYLGEVPENYGSFLPIAVLIHQGERPTYSTRSATTRETGAPTKIDGDFTFLIYQSGTSVIGGIEAVETIALAVMDALLPKSLAMTASQEVWIWRKDYTLDATKLRDKDDVPVYLATIPYTFSIGNPAR